MIVLLTVAITYATLFFIAFLVNQQVKFVVLTFKIITTIYDILTFPIYLFADKPWKIERHSEKITADRHYEPNGDYTYWEVPEVSNSQKKNSKLEDLIFSADHLSEYLPIAQQFYADLPCLGKRKVLRKVVDKGKNKFELSNYEWLTFKQTQEKINKLTKVLHHKFEFKRGDRVALMFNTMEEWFITFFSFMNLGCEVVTLHSTLNEEGIRYILNSTKVQYLFTQTDLVKLMNKMRSSIETVNKLIVVKNPYADQLTEDEKNNSKYEIFEYDKLLKESANLPALNLNNNSEFSTNDVAVCMFTSGSTGMPKGVLITHANILKSAKSIMERIHFAHYLDNNDTFLAYLPMSHIFELMCEISFFMHGVKMAFGSAGTLITGSPLLVKGCLGDVQTAKPTIWAGVPLIFERVQSRIQTLLKSKSLYIAGLYNFAYEYKKKWSARGYRCRLTDALFFRFVQNQFGGNLKLIIAGGAPLMLETQIFIKLYLNVKLVLGYASTELTGNGAISILDQFEHSNECALMGNVKLRLDDWHEGGYSLHDKPNPRGEIIMGTKAVSVGYFENPEETSKTFFEENGIRWWRTGDIGEINKFGHLSIVDRKKDLVKLQFGEYIALGKAEAVLKNCQFVENIVLHGNSFHNHLIALVQPNKENLCKLAESMDKSTNDYTKLCADDKIRAEVTDELIKYGKRNGLTSKEVPYVIKLCDQPWTPSNGLLTASFKARRTQIYQLYKNSIDQMYKELESKFSIN